MINCKLLNMVVKPLLLVLIIAACQAGAQEPRETPVKDPSFDRTIRSYLKLDIPVISVDELVEKHDSFIILDARSKAEFEISHIENARFIGFKEFSPDQLKGISKESKVAIYCSIGYRSEKIGKKLKELGFTDVRNVYGSIFEWVNQGHQIVDKNGQVTDKLHTYNRSWSKWITNDSISKYW